MHLHVIPAKEWCSRNAYIQNRTFVDVIVHFIGGERGGSVVECRTPEREVRGSRPTSAVLCPWARHFTPRKYWLITQEAMAPSRHDWKIVDWDVKPQHNQPFHRSRWKENSSEIPAHGIYRSLNLFLQPIKLREISIMMKSWNYKILNFWSLANE